MELKKFNGKAIELIEAYINESPSMDTFTNQNFVSLVAALIRGSTITTLLDVFSTLDLKNEYLESRMEVLDAELGYRKRKLQGHLDEIEMPSEEVITLTREINDRVTKKNYCQSTNELTTAIKGYAEDILTEKIDALTDEEKGELEASFTSIIEKNDSKMSTIDKEVKERKDILESKEATEEEAEVCGIAPKEYITKTSDELRERYERRKMLGHYNEVLKHFAPSKKASDDLGTVLK